MSHSKLSGLIDAIFDTLTPRDLGPLLVSSFALRPFADGFAILRLCELDRLENLTVLGSAASQGVLPKSIFDDHPVSRALRFNSLVVDSLGELKVYSAPISRGEIPLGILVVTGKAESPEPEAFTESHSVICSVIGRVFKSYFTQYSGQQTDDGPREPLTERQLQILEGFRDGLINDQIARSLLVSSSTVRQESIKIFRHLGVSNRNSAALRALDLGLISSPKPFSTPRTEALPNEGFDAWNEGVQVQNRV